MAKKRIPPELKADLREAAEELRRPGQMVQAKIDEIDRRRAQQG
ncbi:MAG: hypothetical protein ACRDLK_03005 [Gaiellaceae bacterium]